MNDDAGDPRRTAFRTERIAACALGAYLSTVGVRAMLDGRWLYTNPLGRHVPAAGALGVGLALLLVAFIAPDRGKRER